MRSIFFWRRLGPPLGQTGTAVRWDTETPRLRPTPSPNESQKNCESARNRVPRFNDTRYTGSLIESA